MPGNFSTVNITVVAQQFEKCNRNQGLLLSEVCSYVASPSPRKLDLLVIEEA
jgi:hypothetical protein